MKTEKTQQIIDSLATPILYMPVFKTPEGKYYLDDNQIYRKPSHSVRPHKSGTYFCMAEVNTVPTLLNNTCIETKSI